MRLGCDASALLSKRTNAIYTRARRRRLEVTVDEALLRVGRARALRVPSSTPRPRETLCGNAYAHPARIRC